MSGFRSTAATSGRRLREPGKPDQRRYDRGAIDRGLAPERSEKLLGVEVVEQIGGVDLVQRCEAEGDVAEGFGQHSPDAEHHTRPELRIADEPGDELAVAADHRCDQKLDRAVFRTGGGQEFDRREADRFAFRQLQPHESALGLVRDRLAAELQHDRVTERVGGGHRARRVGRGSFLEHRHAVAREELLRRSFGEGGHDGRG